MVTRVNKEVRVTIPRPIRSRYEIAAGDAVSFEPGPDSRIVLAQDGAPRPVGRFETLRWPGNQHR
ncbi:MAG: AbrB/MazE/SpoVT family DNA-binding domain-containing protein [Acetobacteraceae bacterium]|nr:AbrB/MazE/SpoVT family DNA-binding domain-containing protein [Acetobacteraceae bacterium]